MQGGTLRIGVSIPLQFCFVAGLTLASYPGFSATFPSFLTAKGRQVVESDGKPINLQGVCFGNEVWSDTRVPSRHHAEIDYARVRAMGMNVVRFYLNYKTLEADANPYRYLSDGWAWLDSNAVWARRQGVYLIFNMHVPQGGYQSMGEGGALWDIPRNQWRLATLWKAIAARYRDNPAIAGYDLLNEPWPTQSSEQWKALAQQIVDSIRTVDRRHLVIVERTFNVGMDGSEDADRNFFLVRDSNAVYTFHFYGPLEFTHQQASWTEKYPDPARYPDTSIFQYDTWPEWETGSFANPTLASGTSNWTYFQGVPLLADSSKYVLAKAVAVSGRNVGSAWYDELVLREIDPSGKQLRSIPLGMDSLKGWEFWSKDGRGSLSRVTGGCHGGMGCLRIDSASEDAQAIGNGYRIQIKRGHRYAIDGWMKGQNVPMGAECRLRVDFESVPGGLFRRNKAFMSAQIDSYLNFGVTHSVPMYLGEFGTIDKSFRDGRGGIGWVKDMLDLASERGLSFTYHDYHQDAFGIFPGSEIIDTADGNRELIALFRSKLGRPTALQKPETKASARIVTRMIPMVSPAFSQDGGPAHGADGRLRETP